MPSTMTATSDPTNAKRGRGFNKLYWVRISSIKKMSTSRAGDTCKPAGLTDGPEVQIHGNNNLFGINSLHLLQCLNRWDCVRLMRWEFPVNYELYIGKIVTSMSSKSASATFACLPALVVSPASASPDPCLRSNVYFPSSPATMITNFRALCLYASKCFVRLRSNASVLFRATCWYTQLAPQHCDQKRQCFRNRRT